MNTIPGFLVPQAAAAKISSLILDAACEGLTAGVEVELQDAASSCCGAVAIVGKGSGETQQFAMRALNMAGSHRFTGRTPEVQAERFMFMHFVALALKS